MNIKTRITLSFTLIVGLILLVFSVIIYLVSEDYREEQFNSRLRDKSLTTAKLLFEVDQVDSALMRILDKADRTLLVQEKIVVLDRSGQKVYDSNEGLPFWLQPEEIEEIWLKGEVTYVKDGTAILGLRMREEKESVLIVASAYDMYGYSKIRNLAQILIIGLLASLSILFLTGSWFARKLLDPISNIIHQVEDLNVGNLSQRVYGGSGQDEIAQLAFAFNNMLDRLESAFEIQRDFVSHASHELRTPLTSMIGQIDVTLLKDRERQEYIDVLNSIREDTSGFIELTNKLLWLAQTHAKLPIISFVEIRIDEIIWQARAELVRRKDWNNIHILFSEEIDDDTLLTLSGSPQLLRLAFINLMDNACKYSEDHTCHVRVGVDDGKHRIDFVNKVRGLEEKDILSFFDPFYRGGNSTGISGHGIGLPLVRNIIALHRGNIQAHMIDPRRLQFSVTLSPDPTISLALST